MKIAIGCDHSALELKNYIIAFLVGGLIGLIGQVIVFVLENK